MSPRVRIPTWKSISGQARVVRRLHERRVERAAGHDPAARLASIGGPLPVRSQSVGSGRDRRRDDIARAAPTGRVDAAEPGAARPQRLRLDER